MYLILSPIRYDRELKLSRSGEVLTLNGQSLDFSFIGEGDLLPPDGITSDWIIDGIERVNGVLQINVLAPYGKDADVSERFPDALVLEDGQSIVINGKSN